MCKSNQGKDETKDNSNTLTKNEENPMASIKRAKVLTETIIAEYFPKKQNDKD